MRGEAKAGHLLLAAVAAGAAAGFAYFAYALIRKYPPVWPDEALFADPAIHLARQGVMGTELLSGILPGIERHTYWMPPFYTLCLAAIFRVAGAGLLAMRAFSLAAAAGVAALTYGVARRSGLGGWVSLIPVSLLAVDPVFLRAALVGRMDMLALGLILATLMFSITPGRDRSPTEAFGTGLVSSLGFLTHPVGIVAPGAAFFGQAFASPGRHRRGIAALVAGIAVPLLFWTAYILEDTASFVAQFGGQLARKQARYAADAHAIRDALYLGQSQYAVGHTLVLVMWACGLIGLAVAAEKRRELLTLVACQVGLFAIVLWSDELWYAVYLVPLTAVGLAHMLGLVRRKSWFVAPALLTLILCLWFGEAGWRRLRAIEYTENVVGARSTDYRVWCADIARSLPVRSRVLVGVVPDPYFELSKRPDLSLREFVPEGLPLDASSYARYMAAADYIVVGRPSPSAAVEAFARAHGELVGTAGSNPAGGPADGYYARIYKVRR